MVLMAILATVWGVRLTYNFSRQGGYSWRFWSGEEDYRWAHLREWPVLRTRAGWIAFNLLFISFYQNVLLLWFTLPIVTVQGTDRRLGGWDVLLAAVFIALVAFETYSDQLQWNFQNEKKRLRKEGEPLTGRYAAGFIYDGVWAHSRHPNYLAEQSIWIVFLLFAVTATHHLNWTAIGILLLLGLFQGSSRMSESIQCKKYPDYAAYQRQVPRFVPRPRAKVNDTEFA
jgi:steroid 5-alpha reductase family enzyme